jgi:hypothetical protein
MNKKMILKLLLNALIHPFSKQVVMADDNGDIQIYNLKRNAKVNHEEIKKAVTCIRKRYSL